MSCRSLEHPVAKHHLAGLRNKDTPPALFRAHARQLATLLAVEASRDLRTSSRGLRTPLCETTGEALSETIGIIPILRAGLGMVPPLLELLPEAEVWHLGLYRDEATALPVEYYAKLPPHRPVDVAFLVDPMLATGGSATAALSALKRWGAPRVKLLSIIAAQEGVDRVLSEFPDTEVFVCAIDPVLNPQKFIVPGLGDAGDRTFNTIV